MFTAPNKKKLKGGDPGTQPKTHLEMQAVI